MEDFKLEYKGYTSIVYHKNNGRLCGVIYNPGETTVNPDFGFYADSREEAENIFIFEVEWILRNKCYAERQEAWKKTTDWISASIVFNICPEQFRERIISGKLDLSLVKEVPGGDYMVPLYYVTKAWEEILKNKMGRMAYLVGPEDDEENMEDAIKEYMEEEGDIRSRDEAIRQNDEMKEIWKELLGVDLDKIDVDFTKFNRHVYPSVSMNEHNCYFHDPLNGIKRWVLAVINRPNEEFIFMDAVSCLMELTAAIILVERNV